MIIKYEAEDGYVSIEQIEEFCIVPESWGKTAVIHGETFLMKKGKVTVFAENGVPLGVFEIDDTPPEPPDPEKVTKFRVVRKPARL